MLSEIFDQGQLCKSDDMKYRPEIALALGFWLPKWEDWVGWPYDTHRYLRDCGSESYLSILPDRKNLITLIKRFLL